MAISVPAIIAISLACLVFCSIARAGDCIYTIQPGQNAEILVNITRTLSTRGSTLSLSDLTFLEGGAPLSSVTIVAGIRVVIPSCVSAPKSICLASCSGRGTLGIDNNCRCNPGYTGPNCEDVGACWPPGDFPRYWTWPTPESRSITQRFDGTFIKYYCGYHSALDISGASARGKPIVAAADGEVILVGNLWGSGRGPYAMVIQHAPDVYTTYGHGESATVKVGDCVQAGQVIGTIGNLGISSGPHLHFEIIDNRVNKREVKFTASSGRSSICDPGVNPYDATKTSFRDPSNYISTSDPDIRPFVRPASTCSGHGECPSRSSSSSSNSVCSCSDGWSGSACHIPPDERLGCKGYHMAVRQPNAWLQADTRTSTWHQLPANMTLEAWVRPTYNAKYVGVVGNLWDTRSTESGYGFQLAGDDEIFFLIALETSKGFGDYSLKAKIPLDEWTHVTGTYDGKVARLYINGILNDTRSNSGVIHYNPTNNFTVGVMIDDNDESYYQGFLDEIRLWDQPRSADEIRSNMRRPVSRGQSGLLARWSLDNALSDSSGNGHDLTLISGSNSIAFEPCFGVYCNVQEQGCGVVPSSTVTPSAAPSTTPEAGSTGNTGSGTQTDGGSTGAKTDPEAKKDPPYVVMTLIITAGVTVIAVAIVFAWYRTRRPSPTLEETMEETLTGMRMGPVSRSPAVSSAGIAKGRRPPPQIPKRPLMNPTSDVETFNKL